jgi:anti-sigma B factor antagonist
VTASANPQTGLGHQSLSVQTVELGAETVIALKGEFDLTGVELFKAAVAQVTPAESLVLDMRDLSFIDSSGLGCLVDVYRRAESERWSLVLTSPQRQVTTILRLTGLEERLEIVDAGPHRLS